MVELPLATWGSAAISLVSSYFHAVSAYNSIFNMFCNSFFSHFGVKKVYSTINTQPLWDYHGGTDPDRVEECCNALALGHFSYSYCSYVDFLY